MNEQKWVNKKAQKWIGPQLDKRSATQEPGQYHTQTLARVQPFIIYSREKKTIDVRCGVRAGVRAFDLLRDRSGIKQLTGLADGLGKNNT